MTAKSGCPNRWLGDFCNRIWAEGSGQALIAFGDVERGAQESAGSRAWAGEAPLVLIFFDLALDPV